MCLISNHGSNDLLHILHTEVVLAFRFSQHSSVPICYMVGVTCSTPNPKLFQHNDSEDRLPLLQVPIPI